MNFYYHPILGLQYTGLAPIFEIDLCVIPEDLNIEEFIKKWKYYNDNKGLMFTDGVHIHSEITNYNLN